MFDLKIIVHDIKLFQFPNSNSPLHESVVKWLGNVVCKMSLISDLALLLLNPNDTSFVCGKSLAPIESKTLAGEGR